MYPRVRLELEEPDYEHIFYVTIDTRDRLVPLDKEADTQFKDLPPSSMKAADALEPLANGNFISPADGGCNGSAEAIERWKVWLAKGYTSNIEAQNAK